VLIWGGIELKKIKIKINKNFAKSVFPSVFLTLIFTLFVSFFYLANPSMQNISFTIRIITVLFYSTLYFMMMKTGNISTYRSTFFVSFAFLFVVSFIAHLFEVRESMYLTRAVRASCETPICHRALLQSLLPMLFNGEIAFPARMSGQAASIASIAGLWFLSMITVGKGWCSWVCFFGGLEEGFSKLGGQKKRWNLDRYKALKYMPFAVLIFILIWAFVAYAPVYCQWFCPFKTTTEFPQIVDMQTFFAAVIFIGIFATTVIAFPILTKKRTQCGLICPFGAFQSIFNKTTIYRISIDKEKCVGCKKCVSECPSFSLSEQDLEKGEPSVTCNRCGTCIDVCPAGAINFRFVGMQTTGHKRSLAERGADVNDSRFRKCMNEILDARVFWISTALLFGTIVASSFVPEAVQRIIHFITSGSLLLY
jgi:ferredoxin-type protein NapH